MKPHKIFAVNPDPAAMSQFYDAMKLDCVVKGAVMPDVHKGYTLPIGAVVATEGMIFPSWCGYDIGCGCLAVKTDFDKEAIEKNKVPILNTIFETVPTGVGKYYDKSVDSINPQTWLPCTGRLQHLYKAWRGDSQLGTLGGGNHFIEVGYDSENVVWVVVHSGSRRLGHSVADTYMTLAAEGKRNKEGHHGFEITSQLGHEYLVDMGFCLEFALRNRRVIMGRVINAIVDSGISGEADWHSLINRNHNHIVEREGVWIHRKGATHAEKDMMGVIPGNMRDGSFIVKGLGNPDALWSSAHGAGRVMSRGQARKTIKLEAFREQMVGIAAKTDASVIDEAPDAYKNIFEVMGQHELLAQIVQHINPIISGKG